MKHKAEPIQEVQVQEHSITTKNGNNKIVVTKESIR